MDKRVFREFRDLIKEESGIVIQEHKRVMLSHRIARRLRALSVTDEAEYLRIIQSDSSGDELNQLIDAVSTNVTSFFREGYHFEFLKNVFAGYREQEKKEVRIWCSACSSGEEAYSVAIIAREYLDLQRCNLKILATDISLGVLKQALVGRYHQRSFQNMPQDLQSKYFTLVNTQGESIWEVDPKLRSEILFKKHSLRKFPWPIEGPFDVIFCRNAMIYFEEEFCRNLIKAFLLRLSDQGYFFVGHSESMLSVAAGLSRVGNFVFQKRFSE